MSRFKIGTRLALSFIVIFLLMTLGSTVAIAQYAAMRTYADRLRQVDKQALDVLQVHNAVKEFQFELQLAVRDEDAGFFEWQAQALRDALISDIEQAIESLSATPEDAMQNASTRGAIIVQLDAIGRTLPEQLDLMREAARAGDWLAVHGRLDRQLMKIGQITTEVVANHCRTMLPEFKIPKIIHFIDKIPLNSRGKVSKKEIRKLFF